MHVWYFSLVTNTQPPYPLESVDRALRLIARLQSGETLTVTSAAETLGVVPSTAHRLLTALCYRDFAVQDSTRRYVAGPAVVSRSAAIASNVLRSIATPGLQRLYKEYGETSHLMILQGNAIQFIDGIEADRVLRIGLRIGGTMPAYCSAGGKAILADLPVGEVESLHRDGLPNWPSAKIRGMSVLRRELTQIQRNGYAINIEETELGVCGVGAAVHDPLGRPVAAFTIAMPTQRFDKRRVAPMGHTLSLVAADTSRALAQAIEAG